MGPLTPGRMLVLGTAVVLLGAVATMLSVMATVVPVLFLGCLLLFAGVVEAVSGLKATEWGGLLLHLVNGTLAAAAGVLVLIDSGLGALVLTLFMGVFFVEVGLVRLVVSITTRLPHRAWIALSGLIALVLGLIVWSQLPEGAVGSMGALVGVDVMFAGWAWLMLGIAVRQPTDARSEARR